MKQEQKYQIRLRLLLISAISCLFIFMAAIALQGVFIWLFGASFAFLAGHLFYACHLGAYEIDQIKVLLEVEAAEGHGEVLQTVAGVAIKTDRLFEEPDAATFEVTGDDEQFIRQSLESSTYRRRRAPVVREERTYGRVSGL